MQPHTACEMHFGHGLADSGHLCELLCVGGCPGVPGYSQSPSDWDSVGASLRPQQLRIDAVHQQRPDTAAFFAWSLGVAALCWL